jgi:hypothetical protein
MVSEIVGRGIYRPVNGARIDFILRVFPQLRSRERITEGEPPVRRQVLFLGSGWTITDIPNNDYGDDIR